MSPSVRMLSFVLSLPMLGAPAAAQNSAAVSFAHVRTPNPELRALMSVGVDVSPTLRGIVDRLESSDVVVLMDFRLLITPGVSGESSFISRAAGRRYLRVAIDSRISGAKLVGLIGHELQHAAEIAGEPSVVDHESLAAFYSRIGFISSAGGRNRFESAAAIEAGRRVMRDATAHASDVDAAIGRVRKAARAH